MRKWHFLTAVLFLGSICLTFQNCARANFGSATGSVADKASLSSNEPGGGGEGGEGNGGDSSGSIGQPPDLSACTANGTYDVQTSAGNRYLLYQDKGSNYASIVQIGTDNFAQITQNGNNNYACVYQQGQNNSSTVTQTGPSSSSSGSSNTATVTQVSGGATSAPSDQECLCKGMMYCQAHPDSGFCKSL
jgi:hypothetical protein